MTSDDGIASGEGAPLNGNVHAGRQSAFLRYGIAVVAVVLGWGARESMVPVVGRTALPFISFFPAVGIAAWYGGLGPGVLAVTLSALGAAWFFIEPIYLFRITALHDAVALIVFVGSALLIVVPMEGLRRARAGLRRELGQRERAEREF